MTDKTSSTPFVEGRVERRLNGAIARFNRWITQHGFSCFNIRCNSGTGTNYNTIAKCCMIFNGSTSTNDYAIS